MKLKDSMAHCPDRPSNDQFRVGWICALPVELAAATAMLDQRFKNTLAQDEHDHNSYAYGRISNINVVIACLPEGAADTVKAATVASHMLRSFQSVKIGLMVGIGGGVPTPQKDIRLGDVVVSKPGRQSGGVVQYDRGKKTPGGSYERTGMLNKPPAVLLNALSTLRAEFERHGPKLGKVLTETLRKTSPDMLNTFGRPKAEDKLYRADYCHTSDSGDCTQCDPRKLVRRSQRTELKVHSGTIASGNSVIKCAAERDKISKDLGGILCFETEAAGLMDGFPCLVIRGICDYADSHKNKQWQRYAATTAAAYAKMLVEIMPPSEVEKTQAAQKIVSHYNHPLSVSSSPYENTKIRGNDGYSQPQNTKIRGNHGDSQHQNTKIRGNHGDNQYHSDKHSGNHGYSQPQNTKIRGNHGYSQPQNTKIRGNHGDNQYHSDKHSGNHGDRQHQNTKIRGNHGNNQYYNDENSGNHNGLRWGDQNIDGHNQYHSNNLSGNHNEPSPGHQIGYDVSADHDDDVDNLLIAGTVLYSGHHDEGEDEVVDNSPIPRAGSYGGHYDESDDDESDEEENDDDESDDDESDDEEND